MARYLVTGVAGFIGCSLAKRLIHEGHSVRGIDNLSNGTMNNLDDIRHDFDFRRADIRDAQSMHDACKGVDFVLHHAAIASVPQSVDDPVEAHAVNVTGTLQLLLAARDAGVQRIVFAASSAAYGSGGSAPRHEGMPPRPASPYAVQKLACEGYVQSFASLFGVEGVCLRYFNIFGPHQAANSSYSGVIACFIRCMLLGQRPTIHGNGEQSRDFTFIDNVVQANLLACTAPADAVSGGVFNIGTGQSRTLNELYAVLADVFGFDEQPVYKPFRPGDVLYSEADITAARECLRYQPSVDFRAGLCATAAWYAAQAEPQSIPLRSVPALVGQAA